MKVIRANRGIYVPRDPENPNKSSMQLVQKGILALVPEGFNLPEDAYTEIGNVFPAREEFKGKKKK